MDTLEIEIGSAVDIKCSGHLGRNSALQWYRGNESEDGNTTWIDITTEISGRELKLPLYGGNVSMSDYGVYRCRTNDSDGHGQKRDFKLIPTCEYQHFSVDILVALLQRDLEVQFFGDQKLPSVSIFYLLFLYYFDG